MKSASKIAVQGTASRTSGVMELLRAPDIETKKSTKADHLSAGNAARRRVRRIAGVGLGLPRQMADLKTK